MSNKTEVQLLHDTLTGVIGERAELQKRIRELAALRRQQAEAVMEEIGPLLDAWESIPNDVKSQLEDDALDFCHYMRRIYIAVDGGGNDGTR